MEIAVDATDDRSLRAASALVSHPEVTRLGLVRKRPPNTWGSRAVRVEEPTGFEVLVAERPSHSLGEVRVAASAEPIAGGVWEASPVGLLRALGALTADPTVELYRTVRGKPSKLGRKVWFPSPVGRLRIEKQKDGIGIAPSLSPVAGLLAASPGRLLSVVDDYEFLEATCLGAGALLAARGLGGQVWSHPDAYVLACNELGVVVSEAATGG